MNESLQIIIVSSSVLAGIISVLLVNQLLRNYRIAYLSTYFYFLIFLFIFGIYGILGSKIIQIVLENSNIDTQNRESAGFFFVFMGIPFLILTWYMFIRLCREMVNKDLRSRFNLTYFTLQAVLFLIYGFILIKIYRFGESRFDLIRKLLIIVYSILNLIILSYSMLQLFLHNRKLIDGKIRSANRIFGYQYLGFFLLTNTLLLLSPISPYIGIGSIIILFASHLIPIFFQSIHLDKNYIDPEVILDIKQNIREFVEKYGISKREKEIIQLICQGKSNQDISDSLYISLQTVKDHTHRIYLKTGVKNRVQLANLIRS